MTYLAEEESESDHGDILHELLRFLFVRLMLSGSFRIPFVFKVGAHRLRITLFVNLLPEKEDTSNGRTK